MEIDVAAEVPEGAMRVVAVADPPGMPGVRRLAELASRQASR